jgi:hypothetical protein
MSHCSPFSSMYSLFSPEMDWQLVSQKDGKKRLKKACQHQFFFIKESSHKAILNFKANF